MSREQLDVNFQYVTFLSKYFSVMENQVSGCQEAIAASFSKVMSDVMSLSQTTVDGQSTAEKKLNEVYLGNSGGEMAGVIATAQASVDDLVAQAMASMESGVPVETASKSTPGTPKTDAESANSRKLASVYSKHMEALATMDDSVRDLVMKIMGALSADDVIGQRLDHAKMSIKSLCVSLDYVLIDVSRRFTLENVQRACDDLLHHTLNLYTTEEERDLFKKHFPTYQIKRAG